MSLMVGLDGRLHWRRKFTATGLRCSGEFGGERRKNLWRENDC
jgi:hypothetical protein